MPNSHASAAVCPILQHVVDKSSEETDMEADHSDAEAESATAWTVPTAALHPARPGTHDPVLAYLFVLGCGLLAKAGAWAELESTASEAFQWGRQKADLSMGSLLARLCHYWCEAAERAGTLQKCKPELLAEYRAATLRHDSWVQAGTLVWLMREAVQARRYREAAALAAKATFPESVSANLAAKWHYYRGKLAVVRGEYSAAAQALRTATRKAPTSALCFQAQVTKWTVLVQLLVGDIPERVVFRGNSAWRQALEAYYEITRAVVSGDLAIFQRVVQRYESAYREDGTWHIIARLKTSVQRIALKNITRSYRTLSYAACAEKIGCEDVLEVQALIRKAIRDKIIVAACDDELQAIVGAQSGAADAADGSAGVLLHHTTEPQEAYSSRIDYILGMYNQAVQAMKYPTKQYEEELAASREREAQLGELTVGLEDALQRGDHDDDDDDEEDMEM